MSFHPQLSQLGLSRDEAEVYVALLELGGAPVRSIAKRAGRNRSTTYYTLKKLVSDGLVSASIKGGVKYFLAEAPEHIVQRARQRLIQAEELLPELLSIHNARSSKPRVRVHERQSGIEAIFLETLEATDEVLGFTNISLFVEHFPDFYRRYTEERIKRGIKVRFISPRPSKKMQSLFGDLSGGSESGLFEVLFVDAQQYPVSNEVAIYGNKVAFMSLSRKEQLALSIESSTISETMRSVFHLAWIGSSAFLG